MMGGGLFFYFLSFVGVWFAFFSNKIFYIWLSMEVVSFSMVSFLMMSSKYNSTLSLSLMDKWKSILKYFFVQMVSGLMVLCFIINVDVGFSVVTFILLFLMVKLGAFPSHKWVLEVYSGLSFYQMFLMSVVPKVVPFFLLWVVCVGNSLYQMLGIGLGFLTLLMGFVGGIKGSNIRYLMAYSSLIFMSWLLVPLGVSFSFFCLSLFFYFFFTYVSFDIFDKMGMSNLVSSNNEMSDHKESWSWLFSSVMFLMASLPLSLGFMFKFIILTEVFWEECFSLGSVFLLASSIFGLLYIRVSYIHMQNSLFFFFKVLVSYKLYFFKVMLMNFLGILFIFIM